MQYQKDEVRNNIVREALKEFLEKGYEGASIRCIAKNSNTSVGNLYKYFKSKEDLYESIIGSVYHRIMNYIDQIDKVEINEKAQLIFNELAGKIMEIFNDSSTEIAVLLNQSKGSRYENCKSTFVGIITKIITENMKYELSLKGKRLKDNFIIYLVSYSLVESIAIIVKERHEGAEVRKLINNIVDIYCYDIADKIDCEDIR